MRSVCNEFILLAVWGGEKRKFQRGGLRVRGRVESRLHAARLAPRTRILARRSWGSWSSWVICCKNESYETLERSWNHKYISEVVVVVKVKVKRGLKVVWGIVIELGGGFRVDDVRLGLM